jgi:FMN reductase
MSGRTLVTVSAGLSQPSSARLLAEQITAATRTALDSAGAEVRIRAVELRGHAHDIVNHMLTGFPAPALGEVLDAVAGADGLIAVTPVFNASFNGLFKSFFDVMPDGALVDTPVLIAATGGTARHSLALEHALRPLFTYLRAVVVPTSVYAAPEDWAAGGPDGALRARVERAGAELADQMRRRGPAAARDPFALTTSFEDLLPGG